MFLGYQTTAEGGEIIAYASANRAFFDESAAYDGKTFKLYPVDRIEETTEPCEMIDGRWLVGEAAISAAKAAAALAAAKDTRAAAVAAITVEVDGMVFDGDETAQERMSRAIVAATAAGLDLTAEKTVWVLYDNTVAQPTFSQLARALKLAGEAQTALWTQPYSTAAAEE